MLNEADRRAIARHAAIIENYEHELEREHARVIEPYKDRAKDIGERLQEGYPLPREEGSLPVMAELVWEDPSLRREAVEINARVDAELAVFIRAHRPSVDPFDTPRKLVAWIDKELKWLGEDYPRLLSFYSVGPAILKDKGWTYRPDGPPSYPPEEIRDAYRDARHRALAFVRLAPGLRDELPECHDPVVGLQDLRACFATMIDEAVVAKLESPPPAPSEVELTHEAPTDAIRDANSYNDLISELRKKRSPVQAALLEYMKTLDKAAISEIAHHVHGDKDAEDTAIRSNVKRTNDALLRHRLPIRFKVGSGFVFKEVQSE